MRHVHHAATAAVFLALLVGAGAARADGRHFQPVAAATSQVVSVVGTTPVISANGTSFAGGASVLPMSARKARLVVSFRNLGTEPLRIDAGNVQASAAGAPLALTSAAAASARGNQSESMASSNCMSVPKELYSSCMANDVHRVRLNPETGGASSRQDAPDAVQVAPKQTQPMQFLMDLPKRSRGAPATLQVTLKVGDERIAFEFREVE
jgi:hypothetical protein